MEEENPFTEVIKRLDRPPKPNYRDLAFQWLNLGREERIASNLPTNQKDFAYSIGIGTTKMKEYRREFFALNMKGRIDHSYNNGEGQNNAEISGDERLALARKVYTDAMRQGASAKDKDLAVRMLGMLIDRQEVKVGLSADEIARRNTEAERELEEWHRRKAGQGVEEVQEGHPLLS